MSAFKCLLQEGIKAENCLVRFRVLKRHSTLGTSPHPKKGTPFSESALECEADKFRGDIGRKDEDLLSGLKDAMAKLNATYDQEDRRLAESFAARCKVSRRRLVYLGIAIGVYYAAFYEALVSIKRSAKEVDGPSPQQA